MSQYHDIPPYLRRKAKERDWFFAEIAFIVSVLIFATVIALNMGALPHAQAAERTYTGIVKDGVVITPQTFCNTL